MILTVVQFVQNPVSNVTVDDHTESGFLCPICLQCCNDCDVNFPDQFLQNSHRMGDGNMVIICIFDISFTEQPTECRMEICKKCMQMLYEYLLCYTMVVTIFVRVRIYYCFMLAATQINRRKYMRSLLHTAAQCDKNTTI